MNTTMRNDTNVTKSIEYVYSTMVSPVGELRLVGSEQGLAAVLWQDDRPNRVRVKAAKEDRNHPLLIEAQRQLEQYFAGQRTTFDLPLDFIGTDFQKSVWGELLKIPFGETRTYGEIAANLGDRRKMRAVGAANGRNPISVIAPCHRVIGASGALVGFAGGLGTKALLLDLERGKLGFDFGNDTAADCLSTLRTN